MNGGDGESERWARGKRDGSGGDDGGGGGGGSGLFVYHCHLLPPRSRSHPRPRPPPSPACLSSLEGRAERRMIKKNGSHSEFKAEAPFHLFQDNHVGLDMYITANRQSWLPALPAGPGGSAETVVQQTSA